MLAAGLTGEVDEVGSAGWVAADPALDVLQEELALVAEAASGTAEALDVTFERLFAAAPAPARRCRQSPRRPWSGRPAAGQAPPPE